MRIPATKLLRVALWCAAVTLCCAVLRCAVLWCADLQADGEVVCKLSGEEQLRIALHRAAYTHT
jgi:hypothetical protein